jgi:hypothetical protein
MKPKLNLSFESRGYAHATTDSAGLLWGEAVP